MGVKLLMLKGLPGSGKSTHAKKLEAEGWTRANKDDIRAEFFPNYDYKDEKEVLRLEDMVIRSALFEGDNVVVDDTNFNQQDRLEKIAKEFDAEFEVLFIDTPVEECIKRNRKRAKNVPMEAILGMYDKYIAPYRNEKVEYDDNLEECIIVDMDGTLAHPSGRNIYDASLADSDTVDDAVSNIVGMAYGHGYKVIILTGRSEEHIHVTKGWLDKNGIDYDEIYCRPVEEHPRADYDIKRELYENHIKGKYNVKYVIDDRPSVCRTWRRLGLKVLQVGNPHKEF